MLLLRHGCALLLCSYYRSFNTRQCSICWGFCELWASDGVNPACSTANPPGEPDGPPTSPISSAYFFGDLIADLADGAMPAAAIFFRTGICDPTGSGFLFGLLSFFGGSDLAMMMVPSVCWSMTVELFTQSVEWPQ